MDVIVSFVLRPLLPVAQTEIVFLYEGVGLQSFTCWDCGLESRQRHACYFVVSVVCSGRGLCEELITRPEESFRMCCVVVCDLETTRMRRPSPAMGPSSTRGGGEE